MEDKFEALISDQLQNNFGIVDGFIDGQLVEDLKQNLLNKYKKEEMQPAGVGNHFHYKKNSEVRGDLIYWLDRKNNDAVENRFLDVIENFIFYINRTCYAGINGYEFHYALYEKGSFYKKHRDQFRSDFGRKFSLVTYLNDDWKEENGGEIVIYTGEDQKKCLPLGGRSIFFKSDEIEHEVLPAGKDRLSIAGWLKKT